ncbi:MAG: response regulator [Flavobacteriales bacterium]|nr:response regulator [Flavobacteriales bacterium]
MEKARILIVEDEPLIAEDLANMVEDLGHVVCARAHEAINAMDAAERERPDIVLLDIQLGNGADGVEVAQRLKQLVIPFLFVTSHTDPATMQRVAATKPQGFIIKPFEADDVRTQLTIALARLTDGAVAEVADRTHELLLRDKGRLVKVAVNAIMYAEADNNYVVIHTKDRRYVISETLHALEARIGSPHFLRIHRGYLVDVRKITALREREAMIGDVVLPVGRTHRAALLQKWRGTNEE